MSFPKVTTQQVVFLARQKVTSLVMLDKPKHPESYKLAPKGKRKVNRFNSEVMLLWDSYILLLKFHQRESVDMSYDGKLKAMKIRGQEERHKRVIKSLDDEKITDILKSTKGHQASKWGRRYICKKLSNCESLSRTDRRYIKGKKNSKLADLAIRHLGFDDSGFKGLSFKGNNSASYLLYYWKLKSQKGKVERPCVYVIGNDDFVKVGFSTNVTKRLKSIQTGCPYPLKIIKVFSGLDKDAEKIFHTRLKEWNTHGEWFKRNKEVERILEIE